MPSPRKNMGLGLGCLVIACCVSFGSFPWLIMFGYALLNPPQTTPWDAPGPMPLNDGSWVRQVHEEGRYSAIRKIITWRHHDQTVSPKKKALPLVSQAVSSTSGWCAEQIRLAPDGPTPRFSRLVMVVSLEPDLAVVTLRRSPRRGERYAFSGWPEGRRFINSAGAYTAWESTWWRPGTAAPRGDHVLVVSPQGVVLDLSSAQTGETISLTESGVGFSFSVLDDAFQVERRDRSEADRARPAEN